jgi:hypothetical protein
MDVFEYVMLTKIMHIIYDVFSIVHITNEERLLDIYADPAEIEIDENYLGPQINFPLELDNALDLVRYFQQGKVCLTLNEFSILPC